MIETKNVKKRANNLSIYRLIATICVLQFHLFFILYNRAIPYEMLLSKGVQGLTALSGFLYAQKIIKDYKGFYLGNLKKIVVPALVCFTIMAIWNLVYMLIFQNWNYISLFTDHRLYNNSLLIQPGNYYYIAYIFLCYLVTPVLQRNDKWSLLVVIGTLLIELTVGFFFGPAIIATSYIVGYYIGRKCYKQLTDVEEKFSIWQLLIWLATTVGSIGLYIIFTEFPFGENYFLTHLNSLARNVVMTTFGIFSFFLIVHALRWTNKFSTIKPLIFTDKLSLIIYLFNQAFMCGAMNVAIWVEPMWAKTLLVYVFTIVISIAAHFVSTLFLKPRQNKESLKQA